MQKTPACTRYHPAGAGIRRALERWEKKQQRCQGREAEMAGDRWDHTAVTADSTLVVSLVVGKRPHEQTNTLVQDAQRRLRSGHLPAIFPEASAG